MFKMSIHLVRMLEAADISPEHLNALMDRRIAARKGAMRFDGAIPRRLMKANGVEVDLIRRLNRRFLCEVNDRRFIYRERSRSDVVLIVPVSIPAAIAISASGLELERIVDLGDAAAFLRGARIAEPVDSYEGSVAFRLEPRWVVFDG